MSIRISLSISNEILGELNKGSYVQLINLFDNSNLQVGGEVEKLENGKVYLLLNSVSDKKHLVSYLQLQFLEFKFDGAQFLSLSLPLVNLTKEQTRFDKEPISDPYFEFIFGFFRGSHSIQTGNAIDLELLEEDSIFTYFIELLNIVNEYSKHYDDFKTELNGVIRGLEKLKQQNAKNETVFNFFIGLANFYLGKYKEATDIFLLINPDPAFPIFSVLDQFANRILNFIGTGKIQIEDKPTVVLVPSSLGDFQDIDVLKQLEENLKLRYDLEAVYPELNNYDCIEDLLNDKEKYNKASLICFMGHGSSTNGIQVILNNSVTDFLNFSNVSQIVNNLLNQKKTLILLSCDGNYYDSFLNTYCNDYEINGTIEIVYCLDSFSFQKMELFMAGFLRGYSHGLSFNECVSLGKDLIDFRGLGEHDIKHREQSKCSPNV